MSGVDRELGGRSPERWERKDPAYRESGGKKDGERMCRARVAERYKGRKLGRGHKGTSNQLAAVDERDFGFLLSIDGKGRETILPL